MCPMQECVDVYVFCFIIVVVWSGVFYRSLLGVIKKIHYGLRTVLCGLV